MPKPAYHLNWSLGATPTKEPGPVAESVNPVGWITDWPAVERAASREKEGEAEPDTAPHDEVSIAPLQSDEPSLDSFRSSPKSKIDAGPVAGLTSNRLRTASLVGWSALVLGGAVLIAAGPGNVLAERSAELGGVWAAITAVIWLLTKNRET